MLHGRDIGALVERLDVRGAYLYHACQLKDFQSYLKIGGIPSRAHLEAAGLPYTLFETDKVDHDNQVWDKIFVNLQDFGRSFANGASSVPNPFGPILLMVSPAALYETLDVAVCLRSAAAARFCREKEALATVDDIDRVYLRPSSDSSLHSTLVKYKDRLRLDFNEPRATSPEVSCTAQTGFLNIQHVTCVIVDPCAVGNARLLPRVSDAMRSSGYGRCRVFKRFYKATTEQIYKDLVHLFILLGMPPTLEQVLDHSAASDAAKAWAQSLIERGLGYQFDRFAKYL